MAASRGNPGSAGCPRSNKVSCRHCPWPEMVTVSWRQHRQWSSEAQADSALWASGCRSAGSAQPRRDMKLDVVRLDSGDQSPTLATSARLAQRLRLEFHIDVTPTKRERPCSQAGNRRLSVNSDVCGGDFPYDVAVSFSGLQVRRRPTFRSRCGVSSSGRPTFLDHYEKTTLWRKDIYEHLDWIYQKEARYWVLGGCSVASRPVPQVRSAEEQKRHGSSLMRPAADRVVVRCW